MREDRGKKAEEFQSAQVTDEVIDEKDEMDCGSVRNLSRFKSEFSFFFFKFFFS